MKTKLSRIIGTLICLFIVSTAYMWDGVMHRMGMLPTESVNKIEYKSYSALGGKYVYSLPLNWEVKEENLGSTEVIYHADFQGPDGLRGIVQVWNIKTPLAKFLQDSKLGETGVVEYKYYKIEESNIGKNKVYTLDYSRKGNDGKYYKGNEYFIPEGPNEFFRISFFVPENDYKPEYKELYSNILSRIVIK